MAAPKALKIAQATKMLQTNQKKLVKVSRKYQNLIELTGTAFIMLNKDFEIIDSNYKFREYLDDLVYKF